MFVALTLLLAGFLAGLSVGYGLRARSAPPRLATVAVLVLAAIGSYMLIAELLGAWPWIGPHVIVAAIIPIVLWQHVRTAREER